MVGLVGGATVTDGATVTLSSVGVLKQLPTEHTAVPLMVPAAEVEMGMVLPCPEAKLLFGPTVFQNRVPLQPAVFDSESVVPCVTVRLPPKLGWGEPITANVSKVGELGPLLLLQSNV